MRHDSRHPCQAAVFAERQQRHTPPSVVRHEDEAARRVEAQMTGNGSTRGATAERRKISRVRVHGKGADSAGVPAAEVIDLAHGIQAKAL